MQILYTVEIGLGNSYCSSNPLHQPVYGQGESTRKKISYPIPSLVFLGIWNNTENLPDGDFSETSFSGPCRKLAYGNICSLSLPPVLPLHKFNCQGQSKP